MSEADSLQAEVYLHFFFARNNTLALKPYKHVPARGLLTLRAVCTEGSKVHRFNKTTTMHKARITLPQQFRLPEAGTCLVAHLLDTYLCK